MTFKNNEEVLFPLILQQHAVVYEKPTIAESESPAEEYGLLCVGHENALESLEPEMFQKGFHNKYVIDESNGMEIIHEMDRLFYENQNK